MAKHKRQDEIEIGLIVAFLKHLQCMHGTLFNNRALRNTVKMVRRRYAKEGSSLLTKTLPKLGKAFDKALSGHTPFDARELRFRALPNSKLPRFLGELFRMVLDDSGGLLPEARAEHVRLIRQILYLFYKYELPYSVDQEQLVIDRFIATEDDLFHVDCKLQVLKTLLRYSELGMAGYGGVDDVYLEQVYDALEAECPEPSYGAPYYATVALAARSLLKEVFREFDFLNIVPRHGPGAVSTREKLWEKYEWTNISSRLREVWPLELYFRASIGHALDELVSSDAITAHDVPARVILVPKDSRGPRLISCEPVDQQWIQQGIMRSLVSHIERHPLTRWSVHFTDQGPNQCGALLGSCSGRYATLDLNEASDRVSLDLVRLLFPAEAIPYLEAARSTQTQLPSGELLTLRKFAPMGSALCFPILALTIWSLLTAAAPDRYTRERILVYGDDIVVPTAYAAEAMKVLTWFGLKVNQDKSCLGGFFRESCGVDAFKGEHVEPVRVRTPWQSRPSPAPYESWLQYANHFYRAGYYVPYDYVVEHLVAIYGTEIPQTSSGISAPSLDEIPAEWPPLKRRFNKGTQRWVYRVNYIKGCTISHELDGWSMLLRHFTASGDLVALQKTARPVPRGGLLEAGHSVDSYTRPAFAVRQYTPRDTSMLVKAWR